MYGTLIVDDGLLTRVFRYQYPMVLLQKANGLNCYFTEVGLAAYFPRVELELTDEQSDSE